MYWEIYKDNDGRWRWSLIAHGGKKIADSSGSFLDQQGAEESVQTAKDAAIAPVKVKGG
jgi:uncharacterized protein YegP (UPF0339 family)